MKKIMIIGMIAFFTLMGCKKSSDEGKKILQKILQIVGIPYNIVVNICQDANGDGLCGATELHTKITLNRGDSIEDIWQKISLTEDGRYFLETKEPKIPILLEIQDADNVAYDGGKFTIPFNGFKNYEQNETKELSILASMVDKNLLADSELTAIRNLNNPDTQDRFYAKLLEDLETNINTLRGVGVDAQNSMLADLKEMALGLKEDGIADRLPQELNRCGVDMSCVDDKLEKTSIKTVITQDKAQSIKNTQPSPTPTPVASNDSGYDGKKLLLSKETTITKDSNGQEDIDTTTYQYNSKNQMISSTSKESYNGHSGDTKECTMKYDNNRFIEDICTEQIDFYGTKQTHTNRTVYSYRDNKIMSIIDYYDGHLESKYEVVNWHGDKASKIVNTEYNQDGTEKTSEGESTVIEWSGDKAIKIKSIEHDFEDEIESVGTTNMSYSGDNPTHIDMGSTMESTAEYTEITITMSIDRTFDNKKTPYFWSYPWDIYNVFFEYYLYGLNKNNIIKEVTNMNGGNIETTVNSIKYNSSGMPIEIHSKTTRSIESVNREEITTYEYIEAK